MKIYPIGGAKKTKPIQSQMPAFGRRLKALSPKSWIPHQVRNDRTANGGAAARLDARMKKQTQFVKVPK